MSRNTLLRPVHQTRLSDQAYEALRDSILRRELPPGHRLDLDDLQQQLGISRTPLKDAINRLATEGLVTIVPRRGSYVTELTVQDVAERFDVRQILELGVVDQIMHSLTDEDLDPVRQLYGNLEALVTPDGLLVDYFKFLDRDREFHRSIVHLAGNKLFLEIYDGLNLHLQMAKVFYLARDKRVKLVDQEHRQILLALEERDARTLKIAIRNHIQSSKQAVLSGIELEANYDANDRLPVPDQVVMGIDE